MSEVQTVARTWTASELAEHWRCSRSYIVTLRHLGDAYGPGLHPTRGGLWANFCLGRARRYRQEAVDAHERHMERLERDAAYVARQLERARKLGLSDAVDDLLRRLKRMGEQRRAVA